MAAQILSFAPRAREPASRDWSSQELAEFYRVESALLQAGLALEGDRGLTDEGDPWFVFCRVDTGEVFIHFARVDGWYVVDGAAFGTPSRGRDFGALVRDLIASHPLASTRRPGSNVLMHPAALLIALVGAAFFQSGKAKAAEAGGHASGEADAGRAGPERRGLTVNAGGAASAADAAAGRFVALDATEVAAVLTGVAIGLRDVAGPAAGAPGGSTPTGGVGGVGGGPEFLRDGAARTAATSGAAALSILSASEARAALTVMAVFHDLARSVVVSTEPASLPASTAVTVMVIDPALHTEVATATAPSSQPPAPVLVVHLAGGPLPQIEALALVSADGALARVSPDRVVHVDQLPSLLSDLIAHGDIVTFAATTAAAPGGSDAPPPPSSDHAAAALPTGGVAHDAVATPPAVVVDTGHGHAADGSDGAAAPATPSVVDPAPAPSESGVAPVETISAPAPPSPPAGGDHSALIDAAVLAFVNQVADVQVVISGHEVVFYDPVILGVLRPDVALDSVTWRLEDGSSVSLVGTATELHAFHGVG